MSLPPSLPRLQSSDDLLNWANQLVNDLELILDTLSTPVSDGWAGTNYTPTRTIDASAATLAETRTVLATLIEDAKAKGTLSR